MKTVLTFHRGEPVAIPERVLESAGIDDGEQVEVEVRPAEIGGLRGSYRSLRDAAAALRTAARR